MTMLKLTSVKQEQNIFYCANTLTVQLDGSHVS